MSNWDNIKTMSLAEFVEMTMQPKADQAKLREQCQHIRMGNHHRMLLDEFEKLHAANKRLVIVR